MTRSRSIAIALLTLALLHQVMAGAFACKAVLCDNGLGGLGGLGGVPQSTTELTCCVDQHPTIAADSCGMEDITHVALAGDESCRGCTDHDLLTQLMLPLPAHDQALPTDSLVLLEVRPWPAASPSLQRKPSNWRIDRSPPSLRFLRTVVLHC